ncbi:aldolase/citrate lyase family protein [Maribellus sp. YY47]|uniref:HpcH/HpaI aldolase family protein n=1 Tax=Maribellus sp. YY47 TaxID=2929486 RepID=UPI0020016C38|nr:aldolase/citrate lyase family protein [Maribellus sp. YY47]MCK3685578.1 aldolase/citrate lyase family protein [Maribellus sp. YY47]
MTTCTGLLKRKIENKETLLSGCVFDSRSGSVIEMYHEIGFDMVLIDREHGGFNSETVFDHIRLARALNFPCMVRVAEPSYAELNRVMDQAPDGIFVPRIRTRKDVEDFMRLIKFPPYGIKGYAGSACPAGKYLGWERPLEQFDYFNRDFVVGIQIETAESIENLDDILSVPGIDVALVGNDDLSLGMGIPTQTDKAEYIETVKTVITTCNKYGVLPGIACGDPKKIKFWRDQGMCLFWAAFDVVSMWQHTKQVYQSIQQELT